MQYTDKLLHSLKKKKDKVSTNILHFPNIFVSYYQVTHPLTNELCYYRYEQG